MKGYFLYCRGKPLDRIVRCYLTMDCSLKCSFCSAGVPHLDTEKKPKPIPPEQWAEGLNARNRYTILAGGEPFLYPHWNELISMLDSTYKIEIYSNLTLPVEGFIKAAKKSYSFLVSLHDCDFEAWDKRVELLRAAGHGVRVHIVKVGNWQRRREFLAEKGYDGKIKITGCGDQRAGVKSMGYDANVNNPTVTCKMQAFFFGPDGYRYPCVTLLGKGEKKLEHILDADGEDSQITECAYYGLCVGCDNNASGWVKRGLPIDKLKSRVGVKNKRKVFVSPTYYKENGNPVYLCPIEHKSMLEGFSEPLNNEAIKIQESVPILDKTGKCRSCNFKGDLLDY